jgi:hypothetical protein
MKRWFAIAAALAALGVGYWMGRARAGVPAMTPLFYGGLLEDGNGPLSGSHAVTTRLWDAASGGNALCTEGPAGTTQLSAGRFRVPLDATCTAAVHANADVWIEVQVDGTALPRAKVGAMPYALEAGAVGWSNVGGLTADTVWPGKVTVTVGTRSYSINAKYCGSTAPHDGNLGGQLSAKTRCEATCNSPSAHLCEFDELFRYAQVLGGTVPAGGWFNGTSNNNCTTTQGSWNTNDSASFGSLWSVSGNCSQSFPVLCCD